MCFGVSTWYGNKDVENGMKAAASEHSKNLHNYLVDYQCLSDS